MGVPGRPLFRRRYKACVAGVRSQVMASKLVLGIAILGFMAGCQLPGQTTCNTMIDWVNFIQVGSTQYVSGVEAGGAIQRKPGRVPGDDARPVDRSAGRRLQY